MLMMTMLLMTKLAHVVLASTLAWAACSSRAAEPPPDPMSDVPFRLRLDTAGGGRVFEGLGALSAGGTSRLLVDYPPQQQSEILDFLFKPKFGASMQHLKVEIGGDSTVACGVEPTHMRSRRDYNPNRGYEWWLMKEALKRNPNIILDCLEWGVPAWIGDGDVLSADNADYIVRFLQAGRKTHGLRIRHVGIWNEMPWTPEYVKLLRRKLDRAGLRDVAIVAADSYNDWSVADRMREDRALYDAVAAVGVHYPKFNSTPVAQALGKPLWSSEDGPWSSGWDSVSPYSASLASAFNRNYIEGRMTKTVVCGALSAFSEVFFIPDTGIMTARWPWCGHYRVPPAVWVMAQTTQFAEPGWKYTDSGCALLPSGGSVVALRDPNNGDWSVIIETLEARSVRTVDVAVGAGLKTGTVRVWKSTKAEQFVRQPDMAIGTQAPLRLVLETNTMYSLTTTDGQQKGQSSPPPLSAFPLPYREDFERYKIGGVPRYWCDLVGAFEVVKRTDGKGKALRQVLERRPTDWSPDWINHYPHTYLAETNLTHYSWSAEVMLEKPGGGGDYRPRVALCVHSGANDGLFRESGALFARLQSQRRLASAHRRTGPGQRMARRIAHPAMAQTTASIRSSGCNCLNRRTASRRGDGQFLHSRLRRSPVQLPRRSLRQPPDSSTARQGEMITLA